MDGVDSLRLRMDTEARFHRVLSGYDPEEVRECLEEMKRLSAQQTKAAKLEQETILRDLDSARSEIEARNCAIRSLKASLEQRDGKLSEANARIMTLVQNAKKHEAARGEYERTRAAAEQLQTLERDAQQLRAALNQAAAVGEKWRDERTRLLAENERLRAEGARLTAERDEARICALAAAVESRAGTERAGAEQRNCPREPEPSGSTAEEIANRLKETFAEACELLDRLKANEDSDRTSRTSAMRMQVLRPDGSSGEHGAGGRR